jgi:hypothetical protein
MSAQDKPELANTTIRLRVTTRLGAVRLRDHASNCARSAVETLIGGMRTGRFRTIR